MLNLSNLSQENLERIQKAIKIVLDTVELQGLNRLTGNKTPLKSFEKEGFSYEEVKTIFCGIDKKQNIISINNEYLKEKYREMKEQQLFTDESSHKFEKERIFLTTYGASLEDLKNYIFFTVKNLNELKTIKERVDETIANYNKKMISPLKEVGEKQKEEIKKEIVEEIKGKKEIIKERKNLITRDKLTGDFYYKNKPINFENKDTIYYLIFECLYEKGDLEGFCSYENINKYLEEHGKEEYKDERQIRDRIKNGIMNLFRFSNLPPKAPDGKELIQKVRGKGIILYNPPL